MSHNRPNRSVLTPDRPRSKQSNRYSPPREFSSFLREKDSHSDSLALVLDAQGSETVFSLEDQFIGDKGAGVLADFISSHPQFISVELRGGNLTPPAFALVCQALKNCVNLTNLKVDWNSIGDNSTVGLEALAELVQILPSLQSIDLRNNQLGKGAGPSLAAIVKEAWSLQRFDLRWNELGDTEARFILGALRSDPKQLKINLGGNKISESLLLEINKLASIKNSNVSISSVSNLKTPSRASSVSAVSKSGSVPKRTSTAKTNKKRGMKTSNSKVSVDQSVGKGYSSLSDNTQNFLKQYLSRVPQKNKSSKHPENENEPPKIEKKLEFNTEIKSLIRNQQGQSLIEKQQMQPSPQTKRLKSTSRSPIKKDSSKESHHHHAHSSLQNLAASYSIGEKFAGGASFGKHINYPNIVTISEVRQAYREVQQREKSQSNSPFKAVGKGGNLDEPDTTIELNKSSIGYQSLGGSNADDEELRKLRESYQKEAEEIHQRYISQIESYLKKNDSTVQVESHEEVKTHKLEREVNEERRMRLDAERRNAELEESLENSHKRIQELETSNKRLKLEQEEFSSQNKEHLSKLQAHTKEQDVKLKEQEEKYLFQFSSFKDQITRLEKEIKQIRIQHESELKQVIDKKNAENLKLDQQIKELSKLLEKQTTDHENEINHLKLQIQEEDREKMQRRDTEESSKQREHKEGSPPRDNSSFYSGDGKSLRVQSPGASKLTDRTKKLYNIGMTEKEIEKILLENRKLKTQLSEALKISEQLERDANSKDRALKLLEEEAVALHKDNARMRELHQQEIHKAVKTEKNNWEQTEKELKTKVQRLEAGIGHAREESAKARLEYEQLKELLQGNVNKIISQTFLEHGTSTS